MHHVLVVDDEPMVRESIAEMLDFGGYAVETAENGAEALAAVERERPLVVLLDLMMPVLNGWEFARELQQRGLTLPIVVITAAREGRAWAAQLGARSYLAKPFEMDDLLATVAQARATT